ncbi:hypothetical protein PACTADRAFT_50667 [Pachysolen tannophilus NRRL Y-2460]|uniref:Amino acid permease/ SLC12A domain-containing protein n=1 Tax=Pachysolen tannophilus NRRL Y-2460 TaxID=669874 RepID=A0A1E4TSU5_PACTA|nr:hypothetical protein PACTADRAFT_50667 [Pachysolen tannophilus NRRL Y-2460]
MESISDQNAKAEGCKPRSNSGTKRKEEYELFPIVNKSKTNYSNKALDNVPSIKTHNIDIASFKDLFPHRPNGISSLSNNNNHEASYSNNDHKSSRYREDVDSLDVSSTSDYISSDTVDATIEDGASSIASSAVPISLTSSLIADALSTLDKAKLKDELSVTTDRHFFSNLYEPIFKKRNIDYKINNETLSDFAKYDKEVKTENFLRQKTKKYLNNSYFPSIIDDSYSMNVRPGDLNEDDKYIAGNDETLIKRHNHGNFLENLRKGKGTNILSNFNKKLPTTLLQKNNNNNHNHNKFDSKYPNLDNLKSAETNIIDYELNYNIPIDHQNYNILTNSRGKNQMKTSSHMTNLRRLATGKKFSSVEVDSISLSNINSSFDHPEQYAQQGNNNTSNNGLNSGNGSKKHYDREIHRKLKPRHLQMIALSGTIGVGLFLASGKAFSIAGPLGTIIGFIIAGSVVISTMFSFCEMVTLIPLAGGVSGISSRFVEDAFGFSLGICYLFNYMVSLPSEITAATIMLSYYKNLDIPSKSTAGWITFFLVVVIAVNLFDVRVYGEVEYVTSLVKSILLLALIIFMIVLNRGGVPPYHRDIGFTYWDSSKSDLANSITYGPFRPTFDLSDAGLGSLNGIGGATGRFLSVLVATVVASYAYIGIEIALIAGGEARNPRKAIPLATKTIYWRVLLFYIIAVFVVGLNIYSGDPRLLRYFVSDTGSLNAEKDKAMIDKIIELNGGAECDTYLLEWAGFANGNQSPWVIAFQSTGLCNFASVLNAFLVYFALTAGSSQLYASSRTLYYLSIQGKVPKVFSICSKNGVPYISVLFTGMFGSLAYLTVTNNTAEVFERFLSICSSLGLIVWGGMCLSFIRFYHGLKLRPDIIGRDDENYPYRSPCQPYLAYYGLVSSMILVLISGFVVFMKGNWTTAYFFTSYGSIFLFLLCYIGYKVVRRTKVHRLDQLDLDSGRREIDRIIWEDNRIYNSNFKELLKKGINFMA